MAFSASFSHPAMFRLSSSVHGESLSMWSSSSLYSGPPLNFSSPSTLSGRVGKRFVVISKRLLGLEEAMRIRRERELRPERSKRRPPLRRGRVSPSLPVPDHIQKPPYAGSTALPDLSREYQIHDSEGIVHMRAACQLAARVLEFAGSLVRLSFSLHP